MIRSFRFKIDKQIKSQLLNTDKLETAENEIKIILSAIYLPDSLTITSFFTKNTQETIKAITVLNISSSNTIANHNTMKIYREIISTIVCQVLDKYNIKDKYYESSEYKQLQRLMIEVKKRLIKVY